MSVSLKRYFSGGGSNLGIIKPLYSHINSSDQTKAEENSRGILDATYHIAGTYVYIIIDLFYTFYLIIHVYMYNNYRKEKVSLW